jgi:hypothetical protein
MKLAIQYLNDNTGKIKAVQLPFPEWKKVMSKLHKYEQMLKMKSDLNEAFEEVNTLRKSKTKKQTLTDFLNEL